MDGCSLVLLQTLLQKRSLPGHKPLRRQTQGEVIALDGKWLRGSLDKTTDLAAVKIISAWACENRLVLAQRAVADGSNETATLPQVLGLLEIAGCVVTIDAARCHKAVAEQIREQKGDYVLSLKNNQPCLYQNVTEQFADWEAREWRMPLAFERA